RCRSRANCRCCSISAHAAADGPRTTPAPGCACARSCKFQGLSDAAQDPSRRSALYRHWLGCADVASNTGNRTMFDRITFDPDIMGGRACIRGMRIPVSVIVGQIAHGATWEEVLEGYPDLERADIQQAIEYAAWLTQEEVRTG